MAVVITIQQVRDFIPNNLPDSVIQQFIDFVDQADVCLDLNVVPDPTQTMLKLYTVAHMITTQQGGSVSSETDMDGASVSYNNSKIGTGFTGTEYGTMAYSMDTYGCMGALFTKKINRLMIRI